METNDIPTEKILKNIPFIEEVSVREGLALLLDNQFHAFDVIKHKLDEIETVIDCITNKIRNGKNIRIIYAGAGTSARIGVQDGVELYPTFGWPLDQIAFIIAGGLSALTSSIENAEDDENDAIKQVKLVGVNHKDIVIGIAASGNTPFTKKVLERSRLNGALTIAISNNPKGTILTNAHYNIILDTGGEILTGSTRLKAGTSQKICLNLISTIVMAKLGFIKKNMMSNLVANNKKLRIRHKEIKKAMKL